MKTVEVELPGRAGDLQGFPGIAFSQAPLPRTTKVEPALAAVLRPGMPYEWEYVATRENEVPPDVLRAASSIKIGIVDTGADVTHPDLAAKSPETWDVVHRRTSVADKDGHGTFVAALAAGSVTNDEGIAGFGGDAQLLVVRAVGPSDSFSDVDEAAAIVYAVDHGARIVNLSLGGVGASPLEERAIEYAVSHDVLLVAAAGNEYASGNPIEYPAAALQPPGSNGAGRSRAGGRGQHDGRHARELFEHRLPHLARRTRRERVRRDRGRVAANVVAALQARRLPRGPLRLVERHVILDARSRRRGRARLGREPGADRAAGRRDPQGERVRQRPLEPEARLRRDRRRGRGRSRTRPADRSSPEGGRLAEPPAPRQPPIAFVTP